MSATYFVKKIMIATQSGRAKKASDPSGLAFRVDAIGMHYSGSTRNWVLRLAGVPVILPNMSGATAVKSL